MGINANRTKKSGSSPDRLKIDEDFETAADRMVKAKKPASGWPKPKRKKKAPGKKPKA